MTQKLRATLREHLCGFQWRQRTREDIRQERRQRYAEIPVPIWSPRQEKRRDENN